MEKDIHKTVVVFRKFKEGDIIALFPELCPSTKANECDSYMRVGQHGAACTSLVNDTKPAKEKEYASLKAELESIGYNLKVQKKISRQNTDKRIKACTNYIMGVIDS